MLILTRKRDDSIKIGDDIVLRVMRTARGSVKIGIEAPASVRIVRGELNEFEEFAVGEKPQSSVAVKGDAAPGHRAASDSSMGEIEPHDPGTLLGYEDELTFDGVPGVAYDLDNELDVELAMVMQT